MKTALHVLIILSVGVGLGLAIRTLRPTSTAAGPGPDEVVYTNEAAGSGDVPELDEVRNDTPAGPPKDKDANWPSEFELTERSGEAVSSDDLLGQPYVVSFFFSTCPSTCVQQNQKLQELQEEFKDQGVRFVAISVDPETDTPEKLREYAARFGADKDQWLFLTGDLISIRRIGEEVYQLPVMKKFHAERFVLVDSKGQIEGYYSWPEKQQFEALRETIAEMLAGGGESTDS